MSLLSGSMTFFQGKQLKNIFEQLKDVDLSSLTSISSLTTLVSKNQASFKFTLSAIVLYLSYRFISRPFKYYRRLEHVGYIEDGLHSPKQLAENVRKRRVAGDLPPPFPNGWYCVLYSHELQKGEVKQSTVVGQTVAVFRGEDGKAAVLDAYCPHLGANMACGGTVQKNSLACPFHGWEFDHGGNCVNIPYADKVPEFAKTKSWTTMEINGQILIWFDAEGREPFWTPPVIEEISSGKWTLRGETLNYVNAHIQEIPENGADVAHLNYLHQPGIQNGTDLRYIRNGLNFLQHMWDAKWAPQEQPQEHIAVLELTHKAYLFGYHIKMFDLHVRAMQVGPALVYLTWVSIFGKGCFQQTLAPQEPLLQKVTHTIWAESTFPNFMARAFMMSEVKQVERDIMIWNNKRFIGKPLLVKEDKLIGQFRRWYSKFYSESSHEFGKKNNMDW